MACTCFMYIYVWDIFNYINSIRYVYKIHAVGHPEASFGRGMLAMSQFGFVGFCVNKWHIPSSPGCCWYKYMYIYIYTYTYT